MPSIRQFTVAPLVAVQVTVPRFQIEAQILDDDGTVIADYTGANALVFPAVLATLTPAQRRLVLEGMLLKLLLYRAGRS